MNYLDTNTPMILFQHCLSESVMMERNAIPAELKHGKNKNNPQGGLHGKLRHAKMKKENGNRKPKGV
ncbi:MAG: hypothetical protein HFH35_03350 [Eubacterium sp.]|nr:hypothetical protein [Eubacterium sp.]